MSERINYKLNFNCLECIIKFISIVVIYIHKEMELKYYDLKERKRVFFIKETTVFDSTRLDSTRLRLHSRSPSHRGRGNYSKTYNETPN
jgi:hypothetical protein